MEQSNFKKTLSIVSLAVLVLIGSTTAFLTSTDTVGNWFRVAEVKLDIEEKFDEDTKLSAGQIITKQPWVKNTGTVNEIFFVEVSVPCIEATFLDSNGQRITPESVTLSNPPLSSEFLQTQQIYNLIANPENASEKDYIITPTKTGDVITKNWEFSYRKNTDSSAGWVYLKQTESQKEYKKVQGMRDGIYDTYLLGYSAWVAPNKTTVPIFDKLQLRSIIDADIDSGTIGQVQINAYTIQANELNIAELSGSGTVASPYSQNDLTKIYQVITNKQTTAQEGGSP